MQNLKGYVRTLLNDARISEGLEPITLDNLTMEQYNYTKARIKHDLEPDTIVRNCTGEFVRETLKVVTNYMLDVQREFKQIKRPKV